MEKVMIPRYTVIQYVRSKKNVPHGVVVAVKTSDGFRIGYSLCNKKDRFNKKMALKIALGRAEVSSSNVDVVGGHGAIPHPVDKVLPAFTNRCKKYYKVNS